MSLLFNKKKLSIILLTMLSFNIFAQNFIGKRIAVTEPKFINGTDETAWIPLMVQGLLTTNLQNHSKMQVIDRTNLDKVKAEQKASESAFNDENFAIELGKLATAQYIVVATIIKKTNTYSFDCKITDTETSNSVGKSFTKSDCTLEEIENGNVVNQASRELLLGLGVNESELNNLIVENSAFASNSKQESVVKSNIALAKGMAQETVNQNVVQALSYYKQALNADSSMTEAISRLNSLTSSVATGNIREDVKNDIALRKAWIKTIDDLKEFYENNIFYIIYDTNLKTEKIDYDKETVDLSIPLSVKLNEDALEIVKTVLNGYYVVAKKQWNIDLEECLFKKLIITASIYDDKQECIGTGTNDNNFWCTTRFDYDYNLGFSVPTFKYEEMTDSKVIIKNIPADKITDSFTIKFDSIQAIRRYTANRTTIKAPLLIPKS